jgi:hypothetical protein
MDAAAFSAATASLDQWSSAVAWAERLWPENADLLNNARIEQVVLRALDETGGERNSDRHLPQQHEADDGSDRGGAAT